MVEATPAVLGHQTVMRGKRGWAERMESKKPETVGNSDS